MLRVLAVLAVLLFPATARAEFTVAIVQRPTPVTAYAGHVIWSQFDPAAGVFRLMEAHASPSGLQTTALPVAPRAVPFDADAGPGEDGAPAVVYSRCATEPRLGGVDLPAPAGVPVWATGRGCDVYRYELAGGPGEVLVPGVSTPTASEFLPSLWRSRVAFARRYDRRAGSRGLYPYLYVRGTGTSERQPGGARGSTGLPGPTSLDLAGTRLAFTWGLDVRTEARFDTTGGGERELLDSTSRGEASREVLSAFVFNGRIWWAHTADREQGLSTYRRWQISASKLEQAVVPPRRGDTIGIAPQSASSVFWSQERAPSVADTTGGCEGIDEPPCQIGGDGSIEFAATPSR